MAGVPDLYDLWVDSNRPGARKFRQILLRKGIAAPSEKYLSEHFLKYQSSKQLFLPGPRYTGKVGSPGLDRRWQADLLVNIQKPSEYRGQTWSYALVVVDVFSRYLWSRLITSPMEAQFGFKEILDQAGKAPELLSTDADPGFLSVQGATRVEGRAPGYQSGPERSRRGRSRYLYTKAHAGHP